MATGKRATSRRANSKETTTLSSTRRVKTHSVSSLLGELDDAPDTDIRRVSVEELREMERRGELHQSRADAEEIELDDSFWDHARWQAPLFPPEEPAPKKMSVHLRLDEDVLEWFRSQGKGHLTRMNAVLRAYFESRRDKKR
jgi:uncharacterized protein (DUF4415 family)